MQIELYIAGGCGEHGRNCFYVQHEDSAFIVDCGIMSGGDKPFPFLSPEQIHKASAVFITHSHIDHTGALPWLYQNGFQGIVLLTSNTYHQLEQKPSTCLFIDEMSTSNAPIVVSECLSFTWGKSGHCIGSVWFSIAFYSKKLLFTGDYIDDTLVYHCDKLENISSDLAMIDCAYGLTAHSPHENRETLISFVKHTFGQNKTVLLPVPKHGRGLELYALLKRDVPEIPIYADQILYEQITELHKYNDWIKPESHKWLDQNNLNVLQGFPADGSPAILLVADPQLNHMYNKRLADCVVADDGVIVFTGHLDEGSYSKQLLTEKNAYAICYNAHLGAEDVNRLCLHNKFDAVVPAHTAESRFHAFHPDWLVLFSQGSTTIT